MAGLGNIDDVYKHYLKIIDENKQLKELLKKYKEQLSEIKNAYIDLTTQDEYGSYYIEEAKEFIDIVKNILKDFEKENEE